MISLSWFFIGTVRNAFERYPVFLSKLRVPEKSKPSTVYASAIFTVFPVSARDRLCGEENLFEQLIDILFQRQRRAYLVELLEAAKQVFGGLQERSPQQWCRRRPGRRSSDPLLDANRAHLRHVGDALQHLLDSVHLQGAHAFLEAHRQDFRDAGVLLN